MEADLSRTQKNKKSAMEKKKADGGSSSGIVRVVPCNHVTPALDAKLGCALEKQGRALR